MDLDNSRIHNIVSQIISMQILTFCICPYSHAKCKFISTTRNHPKVINGEEDEEQVESVPRERCSKQRCRCHKVDSTCVEGILPTRETIRKNMSISNVFMICLYNGLIMPIATYASKPSGQARRADSRFSKCAA